MRYPIVAEAMPIKRNIGPAYASSLLTSLVLAGASVAGLVRGSEGLYDAGSPLVQVSRGGDAANLALGVPVLLACMWLVRRGFLVGLLLWPGALLYVLYASALYLVGAPYSWLFFGEVALVTLSAWTLIGIVASLDLAEVRRRLTAAPARLLGGALVLLALLAYAGLIATAAAALGTTEPAMRPQWVVDFAIGTPVLLIGGALLWGHQSLGYAAAPGLLLVSALNGLAFAASAVLDGLLAGRSVETAVVVVHLAISGVSVGLLALFLSRSAGRRPVDQRRADGRPAGINSTLDSI